jgi:hypothetical protein
MTSRSTPGFWRERLRGVGFLVALGVVVVAVGTIIAWVMVVVLS